MLQIPLRAGRGVAAQVHPEALAHERLFVPAQEVPDVLIELEHVHAAADDDRVVPVERNAALADVAHRHVAADGAFEHIGDLLRRAVARGEQDQRFHAVTSFVRPAGRPLLYVRV